MTSEGYKAKSFKGIPIAIEWHADGSVTICKELAETIRKTGDTSWLIPPPPNTMYFLSDNLTNYGEGSHDDPS